MPAIKPKAIIVVQGAQWGSEGKGQVAAWLCLQRRVDFAVRTGAINAGHTVIFNGETMKCQQLPTGWVNPNTRLIVGPGAYIHPQVLQRELDAIDKLMPTPGGVRSRLFIDRRAGTHLPEHEDAAKGANRHHRIGATGKGCSETIVDKIRNRNDGYKLFSETDWPRTLGVAGRITDTVDMLHSEYDRGSLILLEGTQGTHLDLHLGPYPFTTSRMTSAANWVAEAGLSPAMKYEVILVARTYPIRVAGNSGPMPGEIDWSDLAIDINHKLETAGLPPRVPVQALKAWLDALVSAAVAARRDNRYQVPMRDGAVNVDIGHWTMAERSRFRVAASELHRDALRLLPVETINDLSKLFELTTVTLKLRRIAKLDMDMLKQAVQWNRPDSVILTFLNYQYPVLNLWRPSMGYGPPFDQPLADALAWMESLEEVMGVPISAVSTGPETDQVLNMTDLYDTGRI